MTTKIKKITVNLPEEAVELMKKWSLERGTTVTEVLKQALRTENYFTNEINEGHKVLVQDEDGKIKEVVFNR